MAGVFARLLVTVRSTTRVGPTSTGGAGRGERSLIALSWTSGTVATTVPKVTRTGARKPEPVIVTRVPPVALPKFGVTAVTQNGTTTGSWSGRCSLPVQ